MPSIYGLIGYPLQHSFSPTYFAEKFARLKIDAVYRSFELQSISELPQLIQSHPSLRGLNVTIPYKTAVLPMLDEIDEAVVAIGAVNCIDIRNGRLKGYNTDAIGFERSLIPLLQPRHQKALVLGTGGSSKAVQYVLKKLGIPFLSVSRNPEANTLSYNDLNAAIIQEYLLIINTTPLGMFPNTATAPQIPYHAITARHLLYDLVYNPPETQFLAYGKEAGAIGKNGLEMLHLQAEASWEIWSGKEL